jgi:hypothetical protein
MKDCQGMGTSGRGEGKQRRLKRENVVDVFVFVHENRAMKVVEIVLRRKGRRNVGQWRKGEPN